GWTLSYQMGVRVDRVPESVNVATEKVDVAPPPSISSPAGQTFAIDPRRNDAFIVVNRLLKAGDTVYRSTSPVHIGAVSDVIEDSWPAGTFVVTPSASASTLPQWARSVGVAYAAVSQTPPNVTRVRAQRIGLYHAWGGNMDEGWTRWLLEQFEFPYTS